MEIVVAGVRIPLHDTMCRSASRFGSLPVGSLLPFVVRRTVEFVCNDSSLADLRLLAYLPAYSGYTHDIFTWRNLPRNERNDILADMRSSLRKLLECLNVDIRLDIPDYVAIIDLALDHHAHPTITFSTFILDAMATATTQAEIDHCTLIIVSSTFHELAHLWLHVVSSASMVVSVLKLIYVQEHGKKHLTPEKVKALQGSRAPPSVGEGGEDVENEVLGGMVNLVDLHYEGEWNMYYIVLLS